MFGFGGNDSSNIARIKDTENSNKAEKESAAKNALRSWWLELQHQLEAEIKKEDVVEKNGEASKSVALQTTDALQPLVDIVFFRYWDINQERADGERLVKGEQTCRFINDLLRENEDAAVTALKDYLKFKMCVTGKDNETVKAKQTELVDAAKKAAVDKFDLETAVNHVDVIADLEAAIGKAKEATVKDTSAADEKLQKLKDAAANKEKAEGELKAALEGASVETLDALQKAVNGAKAAAADLSAATERLEALQLEKKLKGKEEDPKAKEAREKKAADAKAKKEEDDKKAAEDKVEDKKTSEEARAAERTKLEEDTASEAAASFAGKWAEAVEAVVDEFEKEFKKHPFINRQAAEHTFRELNSDADKFTQNELNKVFNLADSEKFDSLWTAYGFKADSFDKALEQLAKGAKDDGEDDEDDA